MTKKSITGNNLARQQLKDFFIPSKAAVLLYLLFGLLALALLKISVIIELFLNGSRVSSKDFVLSNSSSKLLSQVDNLFGNLSSFLIWMLIGTVFYSGLWVFRNTYNSVVTDVTDSRAPTILNKNHAYWKSSVSKYLAVPAATVALIIYVDFMLQAIRVLVLAPSGGIYDLSRGNLYLWIVLSVTLIAVLLHILKLLLHIVSYVYRSLNVGD